MALMKKRLAVILAWPALWHAALAQNTEPSPPGAVLREVLVTATRIDSPEAGGSVLDAASLPARRASTSDTAALLSDFPGVSVYRAGGVSSLPALHGLADDRIRIQVDGMDLISACANHMNSPLSYIDPSNVGRVEVLAGISPVSAGGDSLAGTIAVDSLAPQFARAGEGLLRQGEAGAFYRSNGKSRGGNVSATLANENLSIRYSGSTAQSDNYTAGGDFKSGGPAFSGGHELAADEVGSSSYQSENQAIAIALRNDNHLLRLNLGFQHIPEQGFPNQRMDMTRNDSRQVNVSYTGQYGWGTLDARVYHEATEHDMNFGPDKQFWYGTAPGMPMATQGRNSGARVKATIDLSERDTLKVGGDYQRYRLDDWWEPSGTGGMSPLTFQNINDGQRDRYALFGEWEARWSPRWLTQFGVRHETVTTDSGEVHGYKSGAPYGADAAAFNAAERRRSDRNWDLSALARYVANRQQTLDFGYARKTRSPNLYERFAWSTGGMAMHMVNMVGDGNGYVGNLDLQPEVAHTLSATLDLHDSEAQRWGFKLTPFYSYIDDFINARRCTAADGSGGACTRPTQTTSDNFVFLKYVNQDARVYGLDLSGHLPLAENTGIGSLSASALVNYARGKTVGGTADDLYNIMPLNGKLAVVQRQGGWTNSVEAQFVAAKSAVSQERNEIKTAGYGLLNLRGSYAWKQARVDFGIDNVFDRFYRLPLGGAYVGQGNTMQPGVAPYGIAVPGSGRSFYSALNVKF